MKQKDDLYTAEGNGGILTITIPRGFPNLPKVRRKYYANAYYFFLPIALTLFFFVFLKPLQYQMQIPFEYAIPVIAYLLLPLLVRVIPLQPVVWSFAKDEIRLGKKKFHPSDFVSVSKRTLKGRKRTSFATHAGRMGVELNPEWKFHEVKFKFKGKKQYFRLFEDIENHRLDALVQKISAFVNNGKSNLPD